MKLDSAVASALVQIQGHADAGETAVFARELEAIYAQTYDVQYPDLKARMLLPIDSRPNTADESYTYRQFDKFGEARMVNNYASDFPSADVLGKEFTQKIKSIGNSYQYSIQELRVAAKVGRPLDAMKASAAAYVMQQKLETIAATGDTATGLVGFSNAPNILSVTKGAQALGTTWFTAAGLQQATNAEILADINKMCQTIFSTTQGLWMPDTLVLDTANYGFLAVTPRSSTYTDDTILQYILKQSPWLTSIQFWPKLNTAGAGGKARIMAYKKDPMVVQLVIPQEFEQFAPQARNMAFIVPCHMRCGGVSVHYPKGVCLMDGTGA